MTTKLNFGRDINGFNAYAPDFCDTKFSATLQNGVAETLTVPDNFSVWVVSFSYSPGSSVWVARNNTAAIPAGETFVSTNSELNPGARRVYAKDVLSLITDDSEADVGVCLYAIS